MSFTYYDILGVDTYSSAEDIKGAYKKLALRYHPDKNTTDPEAEEKFKAINTAYQVLGNAEKKLHYDLLLQYSFTATTSYSEPTTSAQAEEEQAEPSRPYYRRRTNYYTAEQRKRDERNALIWIFSFVVLVGLITIGYTYINAYLVEKEEAALYKRKMELYGKALGFVEKGDYRSALTELTTLNAEKAMDLDATNLRFDILEQLNREAMQDYNNKEYGEALDLFVILKDFSPTFPYQKLKRLATCFEREQRYSEAIKTYEESLSQKKEIRVYAATASLYKYQLGNLDSAIYCLDRAAEMLITKYEQLYGGAYAMLVNPRKIPEYHYQVYFERADAFMQQGRYEAALRDCSWASYLRPNNIDMLNMKATCFYEIDQKQQACFTWREAAAKGSPKARASISKFCR